MIAHGFTKGNAQKGNDEAHSKRTNRKRTGAQIEERVSTSERNRKTSKVAFIRLRIRIQEMDKQHAGMKKALTIITFAALVLFLCRVGGYTRIAYIRLGLGYGTFLNDASGPALRFSGYMAAAEGAVFLLSAVYGLVTFARKKEFPGYWLFLAAESLLILLLGIHDALAGGYALPYLIGAFIVGGLLLVLALLFRFRSLQAFGGAFLFLLVALFDSLSLILSLGIGEDPDLFLKASSWVSDLLLLTLFILRGLLAGPSPSKKSNPNPAPEPLP